MGQKLSPSIQQSLYTSAESQPSALSTTIPRLRILSFICQAMCVVIAVQSIKLLWLENVFWHAINACGHLLWFLLCNRQLKRQRDTTDWMFIGFLSYITFASILWQYNLSLSLYLVLGLLVYFALAKPFAQKRFTFICSLFVMTYVVCIYYLPTAPDSLEWVVMVNQCVFLFSFILCGSYIRHQLLDAWSHLDKRVFSWKRLVNKFLPTSFQAHIQDSRELIKVSNAVVFCCDISDSTELFHKMNEPDAIGVLHEIFERFDKVTQKNHWYRLKTNGDQYICVCCEPNVHPTQTVEQAIEISQQYYQQISDISYQLGLKIGIAMGPIYQSMTNSVFPKYDIWGTTVIRASRLESLAEKNTVLLDATCAETLANNSELHCEERQITLCEDAYQQRDLKGLGVENTLKIRLLDANKHVKVSI